MPKSAIYYVGTGTDGTGTTTVSFVRFTPGKTGTTCHHTYTPSAGMFYHFLKLARQLAKDDVVDVALGSTGWGLYEKS